MIPAYILGAILLLETTAFAVFLRKTARREGRRLAFLEKAETSADESGGDAVIEALRELMRRKDRVFGDLAADLAESERAGARLSRNIQKSLIYAADISTQSENNHAVTKRLKGDVTEGSAAVEEVMASVDSLGESVKGQLRAVETTAEAMAQIDADLRDVSGIASDRLQDTEALVRVTRIGNGKVADTDRVIRSVTSKVRDVADLITVINGIASKTNLLAMNAAIEAAHAGDAGRGFAVVAEEIRNLATSTGENSKTISATLNELVEQIEEAAQTSAAGGEAFVEIDRGVQSVTESFKEINRLTSQITERSRKVVNSSESLKNISTKNAESMEEMGVASRQIGGILGSSLGIANELDDSMEHLKNKAKGINLISTKISSAYLKSNRATLNLGKTLAGDVGGEGRGMENRIDISNVILAHINWVATTRGVIDGTIGAEEAALADGENCDLGRWMASRDGDETGDGEKNTVLRETHRKLHATVRDILARVKEKKSEEAEALFVELLSLSQKIVQILTTIGYDAFIKWDPSLSVGLETFDGHHRVLIGLINKLYVNMESGEGEDVLKDTLKELIDYTDWHFAAEEKAFADHGYPETDAHVAQHRFLLTKARALHESLEAGDAVLTNEVLDFLQDWVTNHIMKTDKMYSEFFRGLVP